MIFFAAKGEKHILANADLPAAADIPVLMYHSVCERPSLAGGYLVTPDVFYSDMEYLHDNGYNTVTAAMVYDFAANGSDLPEKPIIITFDDGFLNNLTYVLPCLEEFDMCAVINVVGSYSKKSQEYDDHNPNYAYLTPAEITAAFESGRFEIGSHTYDMHALDTRRGCEKNYNETYEEYTAAFIEDISRENDFLLNECQIVTDIFAYPYGYITDGSEDILREFGYKILFSCYEKHNYIEKNSINSGDTLQLDRYNRAYGLSSRDFMEKCEIY